MSDFNMGQALADQLAGRYAAKPKNVDDLLAGQLAESEVDKPNPDRRSPLLDCLAGRLPSESARERERQSAIKAVRDSRLALEAAKDNDRQALIELLETIDSEDIVNALPPAQIRTLIRNIVGI